MTVQLFLGDCLEFMRTMPDKSVDAVITDPPYNFDSKGGGLYASHHHLDTIEQSFGDNFLPEQFLEAVLLKFGRNLLVWHSQKLLPVYIDFAIKHELGWDLMFWHKINAMPNYGGKLMSDTEYCIRLFQYGKSYVAGGLPYSTYHKYHMDTVQPNNGHPTPKPMALMIKQILLFTEKGDTVFDPFMGSGTTGVACVQLGRNFIGAEIDPHYFEIAEKRIKAASLQPQLFQQEKIPQEAQLHIPFAPKCESDGN